MGGDNIFKKRREERRKRVENIINQKSSNWLIVCEGKQTEPNYFKGAIEEINKSIDEAYKLRVHIKGKGMNTISLVKSVDDVINEIDQYKISTVPYGKIFVVFDKDSFDADSFDKAIIMCEKNGYIPLWSNQAIEFWFLLYFNFVESKMDRSAYANKINKYFRSKGLKYKYEKNDNEIYIKLNKYGSQELAIKRAIKIHLNHSSEKPSESESCTTVYTFYKEIDERIKELE